jgi:hypothetical protein
MGIVNDALNNGVDAAKEAGGNLYDRISVAAENAVNKVIEFFSPKNAKIKSAPITEIGSQKKSWAPPVDTSLSQFVANVNSYGVARNNLYKIEIGLPVSLIADDFSSVRKDPRAVSLYCSSAVIPPLNITTSSIRLFEAPFEVPYGVTYEPVTLQFYVDREGVLKDFFDVWYKHIFNRDTKGIRFMDTYRAESLKVTMLNRYEKGFAEVYSIILKNVYPKSIGDMQFSSSGQDLVSLSVTFEYETLEFQSDLNAKTDMILSEIQKERTGDGDPFTYSSTPNRILQESKNLPSTIRDSDAIQAKTRSKNNFLTSLFIRGT